MQPRHRRETLSPVRPRLTYSIVRSYPSVAMRRSRFLPVFFTLLTIAFAIALVLRLRSVREQTIAAANAPAPPARSETVAGSRLPVAGSRLPVGSFRVPVAGHPTVHREPVNG